MAYLTALRIVLIITPACVSGSYHGHPHGHHPPQKRAMSSAVNTKASAHFEFKGPDQEQRHPDGVSCGNHRAATCGECTLGHGKSWCHGDCQWLDDSKECLKRNDTPIKAPTKHLSKYQREVQQRKKQQQLMQQATQNHNKRKYVMRKGHISGEGDILVQTMSVIEAKKMCDSLPNCKSFTFIGDRWQADQGVPQEIFFKNKYDIDASDWTTYVPEAEITHWNEEEERLKKQRKHQFLGSMVPVRQFTSEPLPAEPYTQDAHIRVAVGSTFDSITVNRTVDVFMNFFAPWCGHCQRFKKPYRELARKLAHVKTLEIAHMDATQNTVRIPIPGFPTILLFPAGSDIDSPPRDYTGNRSPEDMVHWLQNHVVHKFNDTPPPPDPNEHKEPAGLLTEEEESNADL